MRTKKYEWDAGDAGIWNVECEYERGYDPPSASHHDAPGFSDPGSPDEFYINDITDDEGNSILEMVKLCLRINRRDEFDERDAWDAFVSKIEEAFWDDEEDYD